MPQHPVPPGNAVPPSTREDRRGLAGLLDSNGDLAPAERESLRQAMHDGLRFYTEYNNARLTLALSCFDQPMKLALYELLFLMHVNVPPLAGWKFKAKSFARVDGVRREVTRDGTADLYVPGAPAGVRGMASLTPLLKREYEAFITSEFGMPPYGDGSTGVAPIVALQSVGSIGTIGHKSRDSDLDLQVIYELAPFGFDTANWDDGVFRQALGREHKWWINVLGKKQGLSPEGLHNPETHKQLSARAAACLKQAYPGLYRYLVQADKAFAATLFAPGQAELRAQTRQELLALMRRAERLARPGERKRQEARLKARLARIQTYINEKYPSAEIYLFVYAAEGFRQGSYSSSLEFKESSGSAYELILNYETLMPGIQFTPMVPAHFLIPQAYNDDPAAYRRLLDDMRLQAIGVFRSMQDTILDLGNVPQLAPLYIAQHGGAIYWEAFKASAGNLAKALLNLLRFEMLLDGPMLKTIIQIIKAPGCINRFARPKPEDPTMQLAQVGLMKTGLPAWCVLELEQEFPALLLDPWWLRYKALKIAFGEPEGVTGVAPEERDRISLVIDIAFALHLRLSDVLDMDHKAADNHTATDRAAADRAADGGAQPQPSHRERVMLALYKRAFPPDSARRINLQNLFSGGVRGLIYFENEMRALFKGSMSRVERKMAQLNVRDHVGEPQEVELWLNYYLENFQPPTNTVPQVIMKHLKVPRPLIEVALRPGEGWVFRAVQSGNHRGRASGSAGGMRYLPDRVTLIDKTGFLAGLAHCIVNGYYGVTGRDSHDKQHSRFQIDLSKVDLGNNVHSELARLDTDDINRLADRIVAHFPYVYVNYADIIRVERRVREVFVCLNLFRFGQLSVLYRDNINTWFCDEFELSALFTDAQNLSRNMPRLLQARVIHQTLLTFCERRKVDPASVRLAAWANPNSLQADRTLGHHARGEDMASGRTFLEHICHGLGIRPPAGAAEAPA